MFVKYILLLIVGGSSSVAKCMCPVKEIVLLPEKQNDPVKLNSAIFKYTALDN